MRGAVAGACLLGLVPAVDEEEAWGRADAAAAAGAAAVAKAAVVQGSNNWQLVLFNRQ